MKLSILIASVPDRTSYLARVLEQINNQLTTEVEVIVNIDARVKSLGRKRNELIQAAHGDYVVAVDDDDTIAPDYVSSILEHTEHGADYIAFKWIYAPEGGTPIPVISDFAKEWGFEDGHYVRNVSQICPLRREIALRCPYPDSTGTEDKEWSDMVTKLVKSQCSIDKFLYTHEYRNK